MMTIEEYNNLVKSGKIKSIEELDKDYKQKRDILINKIKENLKIKDIIERIKENIKDLDKRTLLAIENKKLMQLYIAYYKI